MTAKIFRNAFLIGFTVLLACILLFFFIMYSNYQAQAFDNLAIEAEHISEVPPPTVISSSPRVPASALSTRSSSLPEQTA